MLIFITNCNISFKVDYYQFAYKKRAKIQYNFYKIQMCNTYLVGFKIREDKNCLIRMSFCQKNRPEEIQLSIFDKYCNFERNAFLFSFTLS